MNEFVFVRISSTARNTSRRSRVGVGMNRSATGVKCKAL